MLDTQSPLKSYCSAPGLFDTSGKVAVTEASRVDFRELRQGQGYLPVYNSGTMMKRTSGDISLIREVVEYFFEETPHILGELKEAVSNKDASALGHAVQTMQSRIEFFGPEPSVRALQRLESMAGREEWEHAHRAYDRFELEFIRLWNSLSPLLKRKRKGA